MVCSLGRRPPRPSGGDVPLGRQNAGGVL